MEERFREVMDLKLGNISLDRLKLQNLYNVYLGLAPREQTIALVGSIVVAVLVVTLPIFLASNKLSRMGKDIEDAHGRIKQIMYEIDKLNDLKAGLAEVESKLEGGFDAAISTTLESLAGENGISEKIDSLKEKPVAPSDLFDEASVDVRLKKVTLQELVNFLFAIEQNPQKLLRLKQLELKPRYDNVKEFDVSFQVSTFRLL